jgi:ribosomal protein S18 acetylase RimI-like enzyme
VNTAPRPAVPADLPRLVATLTRAFHDDPVQIWMCPSDRRRDRMSRALLRVMLSRLYLVSWETFTTDDRLVVAPWARPDRWGIPPPVQLRVLPGLLRWCGPRLPTILSGLQKMDARHRRLPGPSYYLQSFGTDPSVQGRGYGSAQLAHMTARFDRERVGAYLEASSPRNVSLYSRFGFELREELVLPGDGPTVYLMWRDPA